jgi:hypothetical protein
VEDAGPFLVPLIKKMNMKVNSDIRVSKKIITVIKLVFSSSIATLRHTRAAESKLQPVYETVY